VNWNLHKGEEGFMRKIKIFLATFITIVMIATFFSGFALATRITEANKLIGHVFIDDGKYTEFIMGAEECCYSPSNEQFINRSVQKIQALENIVEVNRKLVAKGKKRKLEKDNRKKYRKKYRKRRDGDNDDDDEIIIIEEEEINEEEQKQERKPEEKKKQEPEKSQDKKSHDLDPFR